MCHLPVKLVYKNGENMYSKNIRSYLEDELCKSLVICLFSGSKCEAIAYVQINIVINAFRLRDSQWKIFTTKLKCHICYSVLSRMTYQALIISLGEYIFLMLQLQRVTSSFPKLNTTYYVSVLEVNNEH